MTPQMILKNAVVVSLALSIAPDAPAADPDLTDRVNTTLGLRHHRLVTIETPDSAPGRVTVTLEGTEYEIDLVPNTVRAPAYVLKAQVDGGAIVDQPLTEPKTFRGSVVGHPGARVAGSLLDGGAYFKLTLVDASVWWFEPVSKRLDLDEADVHVAYQPIEILETGATCGSESMQRAAATTPPAGGPIAGGQVFVAELANDADFEYFQDYGSVQAVQDRIELVVNTVNDQYENEVSIYHVITTTIVRSSPADPYSETNSTNLLCEFVNEWSINQQGIQRDVAQLYTGKEVDGNVIGQAAELGSICENDGCTSFPCNCGQFGTSGSYCMAQSDFNNNFGCATDLTAHELGHLWDASHCSCAGFTMNPSITCANTFTTATQTDIAAYRDTRPCLGSGVSFIYPNGLPSQIDPLGGTTVRVELVEDLFTISPNSGRMWVDTGSGFIGMNMTQLEPGVYEGAFPATDCPNEVDFYFTVNTVEAGPVSDPPAAPEVSYGTIAIGSITNAFADDFETNQGWTVANGGGLTDGAWERGTPIGGGDRGDPPTDGDGSGQCYLTDNTDGNSDVDGGTTTLTSPIMDGTGGAGALVSYYRWYDNTFGGAPMADVFEVEISLNGGSSWQDLETVGPGGGEVSGGWFFKQFEVTPSDQFRIRFIASDLGDGSVVEAGVDGVTLDAIDCDVNDCPADFDDSGDVGFSDLLTMLAAWGPCAACDEDLDMSGDVGFSDLLALLASWGPCT